MNRLAHYRIGRLATAFMLALLVLPVLQAAAADNNKIGHELTTLYRSARAVISVNQALINDESKGDKGLSADYVVKQALANYKKATGHALAMDSITEAERAMIDAVKDVMNEAQPLINEKGVGFKGFLPAIFARQVARGFNAAMTGKMEIKLTAPKAYVRNRANRPDPWEHNIIENNFKKADYEIGKPIAEMADFKGKPAFRYILPEYYDASCLSCHGDPKGELDITGGKKEGGKLNELGGAISLVIFN